MTGRTTDGGTWDGSMRLGPDATASVVAWLEPPVETGGGRKQEVSSHAGWFYRGTPITRNGSHKKQDVFEV